MKTADLTVATTRVLVIEDNPVDVRLLRYALAHNEAWPTALTVAEDGEKALQMLREGPLPDFVILDLNLPKVSGAEILQWIRAADFARGLPVAVVSSSPLDEIANRVNGARVKADCYFTKPMDVDSFLELGRRLAQCYWDLTTNPKANGT